MRFCHLLIFSLLFFSAQLYAQQPAVNNDITGLWKGTLYNDTTKQYYKYEIGISEDKNGLSGFSHTWFILDDKQYYGVKKVKIKREGGKIIVEDAGLIANNYPVAPAKGIKQLNVLELHAEGSVMTLTGPFSTNRTKDYRALTGSIRLERKNDYWQSALIPHLQELNLAHNLSFVEDENLLARKNIAIAAAEKTQIAAKNDLITQAAKVVDSKAIPALPVYTQSAEGTLANAQVVKEPRVEAPVTNKSATVNRPATNSGAINPSAGNIAAQEKKPQVSGKAKKMDADAVQQADMVKNSQSQDTKITTSGERSPAVNTPAARPATTKKIQQADVRVAGNSEHNTNDKIPALKVNPADSVYAIVMPAKNITEAQIAKSLPRRSENSTSIKAMADSVKLAVKAVPLQNLPPAMDATAAVNVTERTTTIQQTVSFHSDSLQLSLYDNGEVDGDTVSVLMNGNIIMGRERLSTNAVRKTIFIPQNTDTVQLVMYAENLGSIPPNTGLLVVKDGKDLYEIRFSGDLHKNAAIIFKRKKEIPK